MPKTLQYTVYTYDELSDDAKEKAREWFRESSAADTDFANFVIEDAQTIAGILGIEFNKLKRDAPAVYWSGFASQGDGASFDGSYSYSEDAPRLIREHAPEDAELHRIADALEKLQAEHGFKLSAACKVTGHYVHAYCMDVEVFADDADISEETEKELTQLLRDFANWVYAQLESANDDANSDEVVAETIEANEYTFKADGRRFG